MIVIVVRFDSNNNYTELFTSSNYIFSSGINLLFKFILICLGRNTLTGFIHIFGIFVENPIMVLFISFGFYCYYVTVIKLLGTIWVIFKNNLGSEFRNWYCFLVILFCFFWAFLQLQCSLCSMVFTLLSFASPLLSVESNLLLVSKISLRSEVKNAQVIFWHYLTNGCLSSVFCMSKYGWTE